MVSTSLIFYSFNKAFVILDYFMELYTYVSSFN
jgi:hypothetical protein